MNTYQSTTSTVLTFLVALLVTWASGCAGLNNRRTSELLPSAYVHKTGPFVIHSHKKVKSQDPLVKELEALTVDVSGSLGGPKPDSEKVVDVYILKDETSFHHFLQYYHPELPQRRAYFIATDKSRSIYTYQGDHLMEDVRHEATHALVNLTHPGLPLWLDEGVAEVFESPTDKKASDTHRERFLTDLKQGFKPELVRLEGIDDVRKLTPQDYREAWAWVEWGLSGPAPARKVFRSYLDDVARLGEMESVAALKPLSERWSESSPEMKATHVPMMAWVQQGQVVAKSDQTKGALDSQIKQTRLQNGEQPVRQSRVTRETYPVPKQGGGGKNLIQKVFGRLFGRA